MFKWRTRRRDAERCVVDGITRDLHRGRFVLVMEVYQLASTGSKAWVLTRDGITDAWFWHRAVGAGQLFVVDRVNPFFGAGYGYGPHHQRRVLYIGSGGNGDDDVLSAYGPNEVRLFEKKRAPIAVLVNDAAGL